MKWVERGMEMEEKERGDENERKGGMKMEKGGGMKMKEREG